MNIIYLQAVSYFLTRTNDKLNLKRIGDVDNLIKPKNGDPVLRCVCIYI